MKGIVVFEYICVVILAIAAVACFIRAKKETDQAQKKIGKVMGFITIILCVGIFCMATFWLAPMAEDFDRNPVRPSTSTKKEKCAWCGRMVPKSEMQGNWCDDCQDDAFGKNGWYN